MNPKKKLEQELFRAKNYIEEEAKTKLKEKEAKKKQERLAKKAKQQALKNEEEKLDLENSKKSIGKTTSRFAASIGN